MENIPPYFLGLIGPFGLYIVFVYLMISIDKEVARILKKDSSDDEDSDSM